MNGVGNCTAFGRCGGCTQLNVPYEEQLAAKDSRVAELFAGLAAADAVRPILGMGEPCRYRDKVISPLVAAKGPARGKGSRRGRPQGPRQGAPEVLAGMYARGTHEVIPADDCLLENEVARQVVRAVVAIMRRHGVEPYDEDAGRGFMRHVVVRVGHESGEVLVTLVTNGEEFPHSKSFCRELSRRVPEVTTVVQNVNVRQTNVVLGDKERVLFGPGFILDTLCGMSFRISSRSFYQVNARQTEVLYRTAVELADLHGGEVVIDAYCGTGTIGVVAAGSVAGAVAEGAPGAGDVPGAAGAPGVRLIGVDSEASSIRDARKNAAHNGLDGAEFVAADAAAFLQELAADGSALAGPEGVRAPVVLFMDPPRAGSTPEFLDAVTALAPERIVYISCNPQTQVRDLERLSRAGYRVQAVQPVDMFPHTDHIECVASLAKDAQAAGRDDA